jgi:hypothetical protein
MSAGAGFRVAVAFTVCVAGCGGAGGSDSSPGLAGVYRVQSQARQQPCDGAGTAIAPLDPPYFLVVEEALLNGLFVDAYPCTGPERATCDEKGFPLLFLGKPVGEGEYAAGTYAKSEGSDSCSHAWLGARVKKTALGVTLQTESRREDLPKATCTDEVTEAEAARGPSLACVSMEVLVGAKL